MINMRDHEGKSTCYVCFMYKLLNVLLTEQRLWRIFQVGLHNSWPYWSRPSKYINMATNSWKTNRGGPLNQSTWRVVRKNMKKHPALGHFSAAYSPLPVVFLLVFPASCSRTASSKRKSSATRRLHAASGGAAGSRGKEALRCFYCCGR